MNIASLFARIGVKADTNQLKSFSGGVKNLSGELSKTIKQIAGSVGITLALKKATATAMEYGVQLTQLSRKTGMTVEELQKLQGSSVIVSAAEIQRINAANKQMYQFSSTLKSLSMIIGGEIAIALGRMLSEFNEWIRTSPNAIKGFRTLGAVIGVVIRGFVITVTAIGRMIGAVWKLGTAGKVLIIVVAALSAAWLTGFGWVNVIIAALVALFLVVEDFVGFLQGKDSVFGDMMGNEEFAGIVNSIMDPLKELWETLKAFFGFLEDSGVIDFFKNLGDAILKHLINSLKIAASFLGNIITLVAKLFQGDWKGAIGAGMAAAGDVKDFIGSGVNMYKEAGLATAEGAKNFSERSGDAWEKNMVPVRDKYSNNNSNSVVVNNYNTGIPEDVAAKSAEQTAKQIDRSNERWAAGTAPVVA